MNAEAIKDLLFRMADDELIYGHRMSEWTGFGPILEEDIAFSSMAQDNIGHALANYTILEKEFKTQNPDTLAFYRKENEMRNCQMVELPNGEYDFSLMRHFLFAHAYFLRYEMLEDSSFAPLSQLAKKIKGELKYHILHADTWITRLGKATEESHARMQGALTELWNYTFGIFEPSGFETDLTGERIFGGEKLLQQKWLDKISPILESATLKIPAPPGASGGSNPGGYGGRKGFHTEHLKPLLDEMGEVIKSEALGTEW